MHEFSAGSSGPWEDYVLRRWTLGRSRGGGAGYGEAAEGPEEFRAARRLICLEPGLMRESRIGRNLVYLQQARHRRGGVLAAPFRGSAADVLGDFHDVLEPVLLLILKKAFGLRTDIAARNEGRPVPVVAPQPGNFFDAAVVMWASLPVWKKPVMSAALRELLATEDATGLQVILGMVKASVRHCNAAKVDVWSRVLLRVAVPPMGAAGAADAALGEACLPAVPGADDGADDGRGGGACHGGGGSSSGAPLSALRRDARQRLWDEAFALADDWKEKALCTVFLEPTKMYYVACGEAELADNVEVHGASVYLAVLLSTLGVWCPRLPFLLDTPMAAVSFLDALDGSQVRALWKPDNFGKPFRAVAECRQPRVRGQVVNHWSNFLFHGRQPWQVANNAVDAGGLPERRGKLQPYLWQFAWYFSEEFLVPRLTQRLLEGDETRAALQVVLNELLEEPSTSSSSGGVRSLPRSGAAGAASSGGVAGVGAGSEGADEDAGGGDGPDVCCWLWDLEVLPAEFRFERAVRLLRFAGLLRARADPPGRS